MSGVSPQWSSHFGCWNIAFQWHPEKSSKSCGFSLCVCNLWVSHGNTWRSFGRMKSSEMEQWWEDKIYFCKHELNRNQRLKKIIKCRPFRSIWVNMCMYNINIGVYVFLNSGYGKEITFVEARAEELFSRVGKIWLSFSAEDVFKSVVLIFFSLSTLDTKIGLSVPQ